MFYVEVDDEGRVVSAGYGTPPAGAPLAKGATQRFPTPRGADPDTDYWDGSRVRRIPTRPSEGHVFDFSTKQWRVDEAAAWAAARAKRDVLLSASDWVALRASDLGEPMPPEWAAYRQALRDITEQGDPLAIVWPVPPN